MADWSDAQLDAIQAEGGTVLVSAAAGSGKTSVLVERVIRKITREDHPIDADKLLIVTFTKSAAAEMRGRIEKALFDKIREHPGEQRLLRQQVLLSKANICTVDSFCAKISREFFEILGIAPDFKIVAGKQQQDLKNQAMEAALGEFFEGGNTALADYFSSEKNDESLIRAVLDLYEFIQSHLYPEDWLEEKLEEYRGAVPPAETVWGRELLKYARDTLSFCQNVLRDMRRASAEDENLQAALEKLLEKWTSMFNQLAATAAEGNWDRLARELSAATLDKFPTVEGYKEDPLKCRLQDSLGAVRKMLKDLTGCFQGGAQLLQEDISGHYPIAEGLSRLVRRFSQLYQEAKLEKNLADYSDLEHYAVALFLKKEGGRAVPTPLALDVSRRYEEIMIDEYQDTNDVQDSIFKAISREDRNRFLVGDVKQCIYSFRQAMPDIFIRYKDEFQPYDRNDPHFPALISLDLNFRSRPQVISTVNYLFSMLMSRKVGGVDYARGEALHQGLPQKEKEHCETVVDFLEAEDSVPMEETEAAHIADLIREMMENGFTVSAGSEGERKPCYRDFCVLLRSSNKYAPTYAEELNKRGIPAWAAVSGGFFAAPEILSTLSFLQVIDNPNQDIPLLSVLMSPVYGFTPDDLASLRLKDRRDSIYVAMLTSGDARYTRVLEDLERFRVLAATMPAHEFIAYFYAATGFPDLVLAMENGESRLANLRRLRQYASDYEEAGYLGLSGFIRFMDKLRASKSDLESANLISEKADVVRIMSVHKSKGLEFPVCIIAGCGRQSQSDKSEVCLNSRLGIGVKLKHPVTGVLYDNKVRQAVNQENRRNSASEELRIFYVALTRAREKLILLSTVKDLGKEAAKFAPQITETRELSPFVVEQAGNIGSWLILGALRHPDGEYLRKAAGVPDTAVWRGDYTPWSIRRIAKHTEEALQEEPRLAPEPWDPQLLEELRKKCDFVYPFSAVNRIPAKVTASAVSGELKEITLSRPAFLSFQGLTPTERGTALHSFMQFADFKRPLKEELERLVKEGFLTAEQGAAVNLSRVKKFLESPLGRRIAASEQVAKEQRFTATIPAGLVVRELEERYREEPVILQGAADCTFTENGRLYIVDFKTDRVEEEELLRERYGVQLKLYARALEQTTGLEVGGCYLYSLHLNREIEV